MRPSRGGEFDFCLGGVEKIKPRSASIGFQMIFFFRVPRSLTAINTCLDEKEEFKGRDIAVS